MKSASLFTIYYSLLMNGIVYKSTGSWYVVKGEDQQFYECRLKGRFRLKEIKNTNPIAVGDKVVFYEAETKGEGVITEIAPRENYIIRKSVNLSKQTHILAANINVAFLVVTLNNPTTYTAFIDRFLVTAEAYSIPAVLLFNKVDTYTPDELAEVKYLAYMYRDVGYECIGISAQTGKNIDKVKARLQGKTAMVLGHSGAGKSTLINALSPSLQLKTQPLSELHGQGQHTTTFAQMYDLEFDARIIDTPGIKGLGVVDFDREELADYFPEFFALKHLCKFHNCLHLNEPQCAVKQALDEDKLHWSRYKSYLQLLEGEEDTYRESE